MASATRRFSGPIIGFLIGGGLQVSGFEDVRVAIALWSIAGVWGLIALFTWEPVLRMLRNIKRIRIVIANSNSSKLKRKEVEGVEEKGYLDHRVAVLKAVPRMHGIFVKYTKDTEKFTKKIQSHTKHIQKTKDAIKLHKNASKFSNDIDYHSKVTETFLSEYKYFNSVLDKSFIPQIEIGDHIGDHKEVRQSAQGLLKEIQQAQQSLQGFRDKTLKLGLISQDLNRASRRLATLLEEIINEMKHTESFCKRVLSTLE